mmetsp:Transcript_37349/g.96575  ORF Transcript_37349/g.96575 Transcript_37349/m.96575 type:complete len:318 (-) Transcript_37349:216-1169(-)
MVQHLGCSRRAEGFHLRVLADDLASLRIQVHDQPILAIHHELLEGASLARLQAASGTLAAGQRPHRAQVDLERHPGIRNGLCLRVLLGKLLGLLDHRLDLLCGEASLVARHCERLTCGRAPVRCLHAEDAVRVDGEGDLHLRLATRCRRDASQPELSEEVIVAGQQALALVDLDVHGWLTVTVRRDYCRILRWERRAPPYHRRHHPTHCLDAKGQGCHVQEKCSLPRAVVAQSPSQHGSTISHCLIGVDATGGGLPTEGALDQLLDLGDARGAPDEKHAVNIGSSHARILQDTLHELNGPLKQVLIELLKPRSRQCP